MNNPINRLLKQSSEVAFQAPRVFRTVLARIIGDVVFCAVFIVLALLTGAWQIYAVVGLMAATLILAVIGAGLLRWGRPERGSWLIILSLFPVILLNPLVISGLGLIAGIAVVLLTVMTAAEILPTKKANWAVIASVGIGIATFLLDWLNPSSYRMAAPPALLAFAPIASGVLVLVLAAFLVQQFGHYSIRTKLIIGFVGTGVLTAGIIIFATDYLTREEIRNVARQSLLSAAKQTAHDVDNFIRSNLDSVSTEAKLPAIVEYLNMPPDEREGSLEEAEALAVLKILKRKENPYLLSYALFDRRGRDVLDTYTTDIGMDKSDRDYFQAVLKTGQSYVSSVRFYQTGSDPSIYFSAPVRNNFGEITGIIRVRYDAVALQQIIRLQNNQAGADSYAALLDENQIYLAHGTATNFKFKTVAPLEPALVSELQAERRLLNRPPADLTVNFPDFAQTLKKEAEQPSKQPFFTGYIGGTISPTEREQVAIYTLDTQPWQVAFAQPEEVFLAPVTDQTRYTIALAVGVMLAVTGLAWGLGRYLTRPIINLTDVAQRVIKGDFAVQATVESRDEVGQLAEAFNNMTRQLRASIGSLEDQVRERTAELALSMEVGQRAAAIRSLEELLPIITEYIRAQFNLYYSQVYFVDDLGQNLLLRAGTGSVGVQLLARHHYLPIGPGSIVGQVAAEGKSIVVPDTQNSDIHKPNSLLPETRSELAVPLLMEGRVIGVLDMQANKVNTFTENNLTVFEAMTTQLAISIDSAQQWAQAQEAQQKAEEAIRQLTHQSWVEQLASRRGGLGFTYDLTQVAPVSAVDSHEANGGSKLVAPVVVQNEPIGELTVKASSRRALSSDAQALVAAVAQQLGQKAENLRLFEQTQQRAAREQLARQITDKVRASRDIESALRTAAEELSKALGVARAVVDLKVSTEPDQVNDRLAKVE